jgi:hypothetical protein
VLAGVRDVFEGWLAQRERASTVDDDLLGVQIGAMGWALRSIAHSVWSQHPKWELGFHPAVTTAPIDPLESPK